MATVSESRSPDQKFPFEPPCPLWWMRKAENHREPFGSAQGRLRVSQGNPRDADSADTVEPRSHRNSGDAISAALRQNCGPVGRGVSKRKVWRSQKHPAGITGR